MKRIRTFCRDAKVFFSIFPSFKPISPLHLSAKIEERDTVDEKLPFQDLPVIITSDPIGAWKCNFPPFWEMLTDRPTDRPA